MEVWDAYKKDETLAGIDLIRGEKIPKGLYHGVAEIFVLHKDGTVLLTQRDYNKPNYPGLFESGAGGSILKGETFLDGAIRELREETGLDCKDLKSIYTTITDNTIYKGYLCVVSVDKNSIVLQDGETIAYKWITKKEFLDFYKVDSFVHVLRNRLSNFIENYINEMINVRLEESQDYLTVEEVTKEAFSYPERIEHSKIGCCLEHYIVHSLREKDGINELSFVAEINNKIVGHIIYSKAYILQPDNTKVEVVSFGPLSVLPEYQKQGVGSALMKHSIECAKELGYGAILFFGRPEYYPRFGFVNAKEFNITDCEGNNYNAFMAMELKKDYLKDVTGKFYEAPIYNDDLNREKAKEFDEQFCKI